jgi:hypothetical protein
MANWGRCYGPCTSRMSHSDTMGKKKERKEKKKKEKT